MAGTAQNGSGGGTGELFTRACYELYKKQQFCGRLLLLCEEYDHFRLIPTSQQYNWKHLKIKKLSITLWNGKRIYHPQMEDVWHHVI